VRDFGPSADLRDWISGHLDPLEATVRGGQIVRSDFDLNPAHAPREPIELTPAAVLVGLVERPGGLSVILTRRADTLRRHTGQIAFPGGKCDPGETPWETALREANEEVGLDPGSATVLATLPELYLPVSSFVVTPVLAWWHAPHPVYPRQPAEVAHVARLPVAELVDPANRVRVRHPSGWVGAAFAVGGMLVWGFTAGIISALLDMAGWSRPWDPGRIMELPSVSGVPATPGEVIS
jgi:8-oxo-dGTP pyrophosphatase MutT (NUDIX family)